MRSIIICLALFTICLIQSNEAIIEWQKAYKGAWAKNCDYPGNDIRIIRNVGAERATALCDQFAGCTHFTWNSGTLFLKGLGNRPNAQFYEASGDIICGYLAIGAQPNPWWCNAAVDMCRSSISGGFDFWANSAEACGACKAACIGRC